MKTKELIVSPIYNAKGNIVGQEYHGELIRCKDCKHRPILDGDDEREGLNLVFPTERCPCQCEDHWYNWRADDDWYCANAERKDDGKTD